MLRPGVLGGCGAPSDEGQPDPVCGHDEDAGQQHCPGTLQGQTHSYTRPHGQATHFCKSSFFFFLFFFYQSQIYKQGMFYVIPATGVDSRDTM